MMDKMSAKVASNKPNVGGFRPPTQEPSKESIDKIANEQIAGGAKSPYQKFQPHLDPRIAHRNA